MANRFNAEMRLGLRPYEEAFGIAIITIGDIFLPIVKGGEVEFIEDRKLVVPKKGQDGSEFVTNFCITDRHDSIAMVEYATRLAKEDCTSVICIDDYEDETVPISDCKFKELVLDTREGRKRLTYVC